MKFSEFLDVRDGTHDSPKRVNIGKKLITTKNLEDNRIDFTNAKNISLNDFKRINERSKVDQFDILLSMIGTVGNVYQERSAFPDYAIKNLALLKFHGDELLSNWMNYYLQSKKGQSKIHQRLSGSTQQYISLTDLRNIEITLPNRDQMELCIKPLRYLDDLILKNNQINDNLATLKTSIFDKLFKNKMSSHLNGNLSNITIITSGKRPKKKFDNKSSVAKYPIVGASKIMGYTDRYLYNESILTTGRVGTHGVIQRFRKPVWVSDNSFVFKTEHEDYLFEILNNWIKYSALNRGSTQPLITQTDLKNIDIYVPTKEEFYHFESVVTPLTDQQFSLISENDNLKKAKAALLSKLF